MCLFQSTRPIRGATIIAAIVNGLVSDFNPRAPYGARRGLGDDKLCVSAFQSTRPIRGATRRRKSCSAGCAYFNPRAPYGARRHRGDGPSGGYRISIHAPHTGRDFAASPAIPVCMIFQSTRPIRGATSLGSITQTLVGHFNPRAPYGARLSPWATWRRRICYFNPRAPYGARRGALLHSLQLRDFNPRAPYGARQQKCIIYVLHFCNNRQLKHKNQQETSSVRTFF